MDSLTPLERNAPEFFIIGAQKSATSWLWNMLDKHPGTSLPSQKEIHYFGSSELYSKGDDWYYNHFKGLDPDKVIGEASTTYFYDRAPYWYNQSSQIVIDESLPTIPELITQKFPERKFIVILRDPVRRAISAYSHWLKKGKLSPFLGLTNVIKEHPRLRILEYGLYAKYLKVWMKHVPSDRFRVIVYEDQIRKNWDQTLSDTYEYLGLDPAFTHPRRGPLSFADIGRSAKTLGIDFKRREAWYGKEALCRLSQTLSSPPSIPRAEVLFCR